jgi:hypothetical protein
MDLAQTKNDTRFTASLNIKLFFNHLEKKDIELRCKSIGNFVAFAVAEDHIG